MIGEILKRTGLFCNTVLKYLRPDTVERQFKVPDRPSKLHLFVERLTVWLKREMGRTRKQKPTIKQLLADLVSLGLMGLTAMLRPLRWPGVMIIAASNR